MAQHAYWRFNFKETNGMGGSTALSIGDIELRSSIGGPNLATATKVVGTGTASSRATNLLGAGALTLVHTGSVDDTSITVTPSFPVTLLGVNYNTVYVSSNSYITFGTSAGALYSGITASNPAIPAIHMNVGDRSVQRIYAGAENGGATFRIRFEGTSSTSGAVGSPTVVWELTFYRDDPTLIGLDFGANAASGSGATGVTDGAVYRMTFGSTVNTGYNLASTIGDGSTATSSHPSPVTNAFDGNVASGWVAASLPAWIQYKFATPQDIIEHTVRKFTDNPTTQAPRAWDLAYSDDGTNWTVDCPVIGQSNWGTSEVRTFNHSQWPLKLTELSYGSATPIADAISLAVPPTKVHKTTHKSSLSSVGFGSEGRAATLAHVSTPSYGRYLPWWAIDYRGYFPNNGATINKTTATIGYTYPTVGIAVTGTISGLVQEEGVAVQGRLVRLYYRPTGALIASAISDESGRYTFQGLEPSLNKYVLTAFNQEPLQYDAVIHDNITAL